MLPFIQRIDNAVINAFADVQTPVLTCFFAFFTYIGDNGYVWILAAAIMLLFKKTRKMGLTVAIALLLGLVVTNLTLKPLIARVRPYDAFGFTTIIDKPSDFSFPSGHATASFEGAVGCLLWNKKIGIIALAVAVLISFSRIYFQVHYLSDVIMGAIIGSLMAVIAYYIVKAVDKKRAIK